MRAIITRQNSIGTYDEVGMNNRSLTREYKTKYNLLKYAIPNNYKGKLRIEFYTSIYQRNPIEIIYIER